MKKFTFILGVLAICLFAFGGTFTLAGDDDATAGSGAAPRANPADNLDWPVELDEDEGSGEEGKDEEEGGMGSTGTSGSGGTSSSPSSGAKPGDSPLAGGEEPTSEPPEEQEPKSKPPIEFFETEVETDTVVFCVDRTGSMAYSFSHAVTDLEGNLVTSPTKMLAAVLEMKRSIQKFSDNIKFDIVFYAHRYGTEYGKGHPYYENPPGSGSMKPPYSRPAGSGPDAVPWQPKCVEATDANKAAANAWIDVHAVPNGCTPISDGCKAALMIPEVTTVLLLSDGFPQTFQGEIFPADWGPDSLKAYCMNRTRQEIKAANAGKGVIIHTFYIRYGSPDFDARCRKLMQDIAADNGGQYTEIGS